VAVRVWNRYYKRIEIPEMRRLEADLIEGALSWHHANNTLVVSYVVASFLLSPISLSHFRSKTLKDQEKSERSLKMMEKSPRGGKDKLTDAEVCC